MNHAREHLISVTLVTLLLLLQGCYAVPMAPADGEVLELGISATAHGLSMARNGAPLTYAITDGRLGFYLWRVGSLIGGACLNCGCKDPLGQFNYLTGGRGMVMTGKTAGEIVNELVNEYGWRSMTAAELARYGGMVRQMSNSLTGFLVVPAGMFGPAELPEVY